MGNIVEAMAAYGSGALGPQKIPLSDADRIIAIGSDRMMAAVGAARHDKLRPYLKTDHFAIGSINSPMQCMMKEICAQCLQPHKDPETGEITYVFSCFNQDQPLDQVDFGGLASRLRQNSVQEKLTTRWISHCLKETNQVGREIATIELFVINRRIHRFRFIYNPSFVMEQGVNSDGVRPVSAFVKNSDVWRNNKGEDQCT